MSDGSCVSSLIYWIAWVTVRDAPGICRRGLWALTFLLLQERGEVIIKRGSLNGYKVISRAEGQYGG